MSKKKGKHKATAAPKPKGPNAQQRHINAIQAEKQRLEWMTDVGLARICASIPELRDTIDYLGWLVDITDPTAGQTTDQPRGQGIDETNNVTAMLAAGEAVATFVAIRDDIAEDLRHTNRKLRDKIEASDFDRYRPESPRCRRRKCSEYGKRQGWDDTQCRGCGEPIGMGRDT